MSVMIEVLVYGYDLVCVWIVGPRGFDMPYRAILMVMTRVLMYIVYIDGWRWTK
jgi:hypothetical protein